MIDFQLQRLTILLSACLFAETAVRLKAPPLIGELTAGVVLGPSLFGWLQPIEIIKLLAEIGIILLLFQVGLETDFQHLVRAGPKAVIGKFGGAILIRENWPTRLVTGMAMVPRGEVGLIFADLGHEAKVFSNELFYTGIILVIAYTTRATTLKFQASRTGYMRSLCAQPLRCYFLHRRKSSSTITIFFGSLFLSNLLTDAVSNSPVTVPQISSPYPNTIIPFDGTLIGR